MKKNYGIWIAISAILIVGICFSGFTRELVSQQEMDRPEVAAVEAFTAEPSVESADQPEIGPMLVEEEIVPTLEITPLGPLSLEADVQAAAIVQNRYEQQLAEIDTQIVQYRAKNQGTTANAMKVNAEYELRLWETELDAIADTLSSVLSEEKNQLFMNEQKKWLRDREAQAMEVSRKYEGSALERVEYTVSLAEQTRSRVYALVADYRQVLEAE